MPNDTITATTVGIQGPPGSPGAAAPAPTGRLVSAAGPVTVAGGDGIVEIAKATPALTAVSADPAALTPWKTYTVKDAAGNASAFPITLTPTSGTVDGAPSAVIDQDGGWLAFYSNGTHLRLV